MHPPDAIPSHQAKPSAADAPFAALRREAGEIISWLQTHWLPVTGAALALPVLYTYQYGQHEHVPLDLFSASVVAGYPALLAVLLYIALLLTGMALLPALVLCTALIPTTPPPIARPPGPERARIAMAWGLWTLVLGGLLAGSALLIEALPWLENTPWAATAVVVAAIAASYGCCFWLLRRTLDPRPKLREISLDFWLTLLYGVFFQLLLILIATIEAGRQADAAPLAWLAYTAAAIFVLTGLQLAAALLVARQIGKDRPLTFACIIAAALMLLIAALPAVSSRIVGAAIGASASGGHACVVLIQARAADAPDAAWSDTPLRIMALQHGHYIARNTQAPNGRHMFIAQDQVAEMQPCADAQALAVTAMPREVTSRP